ncbi:MAG TPA: LysM peptidoglycan-binding domain-containing protein [Phototrophicaceae bacterium]|nr:LysM peptidoglycan-binding domain-containing protein [Phototrophicaceae bacterium]
MVSRVHLLAFAFFLATLLLIGGCSGSQPTPTSVAQVSTAAPSATSLPSPTTTSITCDQLVAQAESSVGQICDSLSRNKACYGNHLINVDFQPNVSASFNKSGDIVDLLDIKSLSTSPLNTKTNDWGIAVIKAQANLPDSIPGQNVTFLIYGDTTVNNPTSSMHAVTVNTRIGSNSCASVPESAVVIQSPSGANVAMNINGSDITLSSTAYITAQQNQDFTFAIVEGQGTITSQGVTRSVPPGGEVQVPLGGGDGLQASGAPSEVMPFDQQAVAQAPLKLLDRQVTVPQPIATAQAVPAATDTPTAVQTAQASPTACAPRADWTFHYTMQQGDSLASIARKLNLNPADLQSANCITDPSKLAAGQTLLVPSAVPTDAPLPATATPTSALSPTPQTASLTADANPIKAGDCTTIHWDVDGAQAVYFEGQPKTGHDQQQECPTKTTTYTLLVQTPDGKRQQYQITITVTSP